MNSSPAKAVLVVTCIVLLVIVGYMTLNAPDQRTPGEKVGDAVNALPQGLDKAGRQLESRTPGDKLRDAASDTANDAKKAVNQ